MKFNTSFVNITLSDPCRGEKNVCFAAWSLFASEIVFLFLVAWFRWNGLIDGLSYLDPSLKPHNCELYMKSTWSSQRLFKTFMSRRTTFEYHCCHTFGLKCFSDSSQILSFQFLHCKLLAAHVNWLASVKGNGKLSGASNGSVASL